MTTVHAAAGAEASLSQTVLHALNAVLGPAAIDTAPETRRLMGQDVFSDDAGAAPLAVLAPPTAEALAAALPILASHGIAATPRGGGMSYTEGYIAARGYVTIDLRRLNRIRQIFPQDRMAIVEAGCTWAALAEHLKPHGLKPAAKPPISGSVSTLGGAASQNLPQGMEHFLGLEVALMEGTRLRTGVLASADAPLALRSFGPDLTGMFLGDCGAFGIKTAIAVRLRSAARHQRFASAAFASLAAMTEAMLAVQASGLPVAMMGLDTLDRQGAAAAGWREKAALAGALLSARRYTPLAFLDVARGAFARRALAQAAGSLHLTIDADSAAHARDIERRILTLIRARGGITIAPTVPQALAAKPFSVRGMLGRDGERWVPVHGIFRPSQAAAAVALVEAFFAENEETLRRHGIRHSFLLSASETSFLIEPMFYWRDEIPMLHRSVLNPRTVAKWADAKPAPHTRSAVRALRLELAERLDAAGAAKCQLGRFYCYGARLSPTTDRFTHTLKQMLDPQHLMNPGVLGLGTQ